MDDRKDCFAYGETKTGEPMCRVLTCTDCEHCRFYKTRDQLAAQQAKSRERLTKLHFITRKAAK